MYPTYMVDNKHSEQKGFALLIALIVVGVVLSVGLVILDLTIKQVRLAATTRDSEVAFHAANAGMECAQYLRRVELDTLVAAGSDLPSSMQCFSGVEAADKQNSALASDAVDSASDSSFVRHYSYEFTWEDRCTLVDMVTQNSVANGASITVAQADMQAAIPGFPNEDKECLAGSECTTIAVRGYNQACPGSGDFGYGVVERKVLLEF